MESNFTVIKGGRTIPGSGSTRTYISGFVTDTRLMGVIGMELTWDVLSDNKIETQHQIFYIDCEEYGLESYTETTGDDPQEFYTERARLLGALGGLPITISEKEARFLLQKHALLNKKYNQELPEGREKYNFLLKPEQTLTEEEYLALFDKMCNTDGSTYAAINYYIMRCVSGDHAGAAWLSRNFTFENPEEIKPSDIPLYNISNIMIENNPCTLCKNTIEPHGSPDDNTFLCESLIEYKNHYSLAISELTLTGTPCKIIRAEKTREFKITSTEAAMLMNRSEFVSVYEVMDFSETFLNAFAMFAAAFTETSYDNGKLFIDFNENNDHVGKSVYLINDDIKAMYYLTDFGQLLVMGYSYEAAQEAEFRMNMSLLSFPIMINMKYEFKEPVLYEFIRSDFEDFDDFIDFLGGTQE